MAQTRLKPPEILDEIPNEPPKVLDDIPDEQSQKEQEWAKNNPDKIIPPVVLDKIPLQENVEVKKQRFVNREINPLAIPANFGKDLGDITTGLASMVGGAVNIPLQGAKRAFKGEPLIQQQDIDNTSNFIKNILPALKTGIKEDYGQANKDVINSQFPYVHPDWQGLGESFVAHPLNRTLDALTFGSIGAVNRAGQASKFAKNIGNTEKALKYNPNLVIQAGQRIAETKPVQSVVNFVDSQPALNTLQSGVADFIGQSPESRLLGQKATNKRLTKILDMKNQTKNITERNKAISENNALLGDISEAEGKQIVQAVERGLPLEDNKNNVFYHGSDADIKDFALQSPKNGREWGDGIYFTSNKNRANSYGKNLYESEIDLSKILDENSTIPTDKIKNSGIELDPFLISGRTKKYFTDNAEGLKFVDSQDAIYKVKKQEIPDLADEYKPAVGKDEKGIFVEYSDVNNTNVPTFKFLKALKTKYPNQYSTALKSMGYEGLKVGDDVIIYNNFPKIKQNDILDIPQGTNKLENARNLIRNKVQENQGFYTSRDLLNPEQANQLPINQYASIKYNKPIDQLNEVEKFDALKDIHNLPDEQKPFYMPIMYDENLKAGDFFADSVQSYKPRELKQRKFGMDVEEGSKHGNRVYNVNELMNRLDSHRIKMVNTESMINEVKDNFAKPYKIGDNLEDGYIPFNPDGFMSFYRKSIDLNEMTMSKLQQLDDVDTAFKSAVNESIRQLPDDIQQFILRGKNKEIYQIPKEVANVLTGGKWEKGGTELLFDTLTGSFKRKVLGLSPKWFINNRIGNGIMASLKGVTPDYLAKALKTTDELMPDELKTKSLYEAEKTIIGKTAGKGLMPSVIRLVGGEFIDTSTLKGFQKAKIDALNSVGIPGKVINKVTDKAFEFNQFFENLERKAVYLKNVDKLGKQYIKTTGQKITTQEELLKTALDNPELQEQISKSVDDTLGDYSNMTAIERRVVRKIVPFYSWTRTITRYVLSLPETNPLRADISAKLNEALALSQEDEKTPEYQKGKIKTGLKGDITKKDLVLNYRRSVPFETFGSVGDNPLSSLNPILQQVITSSTARKIFDDRPLTSPNYGNDYSGQYFNKKSKYYEDLPASEKAISYPLGLARNMIPLAPETEKAITGIFKGSLPDELYDTSLGGYTYREMYKKPKGFSSKEQLLKNFLPLQAESKRRKKK